MSVVGKRNRTRKRQEPAAPADSAIQPFMSEQEIRDAGLAIDLPFEVPDPIGDDWDMMVDVNGQSVPARELNPDLYEPEGGGGVVPPG